MLASVPTPGAPQRRNILVFTVNKYSVIVYHYHASALTRSCSFFSFLFRHYATAWSWVSSLFVSPSLFHSPIHFFIQRLNVSFLLLISDWTLSFSPPSTFKIYFFAIKRINFLLWPRAMKRIDLVYCHRATELRRFQRVTIIKSVNFVTDYRYQALEPFHFLSPPPPHCLNRVIFCPHQMLEPCHFLSPPSAWTVSFSITTRRLNHVILFRHQALELWHFLSPHNAWSMLFSVTRKRLNHDIFSRHQAPEPWHFLSSWSAWAMPFSIAIRHMTHDIFYSRQAPKLRHFLSPEIAWTMTVFIVVKHLNYVIFCCQKSPEPWQLL